MSITYSFFNNCNMAEFITEARQLDDVDTVEVLHYLIKSVHTLDPVFSNVGENKANLLKCVCGFPVERLAFK